MGTTTLVALSLISIGLPRLLMILSSQVLAFWLSRRAFASGRRVDIRVSFWTFHLQIHENAEDPTTERSTKPRSASDLKLDDGYHKRRRTRGVERRGKK
jgi:hypothetical protein